MKKILLATFARNLLATRVITFSTAATSFALKTILVSVNKPICPDAIFTSIQDAITHGGFG